MNCWDWLERNVEIVVTDLPPGIGAQYYVRQRQLVIADDLRPTELFRTVHRARAVIQARLGDRARQSA